MIEYSAQVNNMCPITKGSEAWSAPIPEEGEWVKAYKIEGHQRLYPRCGLGAHPSRVPAS